jgi:hypothetical protein
MEFVPFVKIYEIKICVGFKMSLLFTLMRQGETGDLSFSWFLVILSDFQQMKSHRKWLEISENYREPHRITQTH